MIPSISLPSAATSTPLTRPSRSTLQLARLRVALFWLVTLACLVSNTLAHDHRQLGARSPSDSLSLEHVGRHMIKNFQLRRRKDSSSNGEEGDEIVNTESPSKTKSNSKTESTATIQRASNTVVATNSPLPQAFDGNLDIEFTSTADSNCPSFLSGVLSDPSYEACYPLSLMLETSRGFFEARTQLLGIVRVLDATCAANVTYCTEFFDVAARNLTSEENCKKEWDKDDITVKQFLYGLKSYEMMYKATCLQIPDDDMYCFANAVTNLTSPSNNYVYYLPYNYSLPGSSAPACSWCTQETMNIFHAASTDRSQPVTLVYEGAARQINTLCGMAFVNGTLPKEEVGAGSLFAPSWASLTVAIFGAALVNIVI